MMKLRNALLACAFFAGTATAVLPASAQVYGGAYIQIGPPAPVVETLPVSPGPAYYWIPGYWRWNGYRYAWAHGYYAYRPYAGAIWRPGHWYHAPGGWYWRGGHWGRP
jgi:WXXGXW repeat (2 copies)